MNLFDVLLDSNAREERAARMYGVVIGIVTNNEDKGGLGRVKVKFPWLSEADESHWARMAVPMAGKGRGAYFLPEVEDEVLIAFEHGDVRFPYVIGALWNGKDEPPANNDGKNNVRLIKSRSGHVIKLNDENGKETIEIIDKSGMNSVLLDTAKNTIILTSEKDITLSAPKGTIKLDAKKIELKSSADAKIEAGAGMDVNAKATMNIKGKMVNIN